MRTWNFAIALLVSICLSGAVNAEATDPAVIVVNAPDGPMPATRKAMQKAHDLGLAAVTVHLQDVDLIQDEDLLTLITEELYELLAGHGFERSQVTVVRCPGQC